MTGSWKKSKASVLSLTCRRVNPAGSETATTENATYRRLAGRRLSCKSASDLTAEYVCPQILALDVQKMTEIACQPVADVLLKHTVLMTLTRNENVTYPAGHFDSSRVGQ